MQKLLLITFLLTGAVNLLSAQVTCQNAYGYVEEGATLEYTFFDKSGTKTAVFQHYCKNIEEEGDTLVAYLEVRGTDAKGEDNYAGMYTMKCTDGTVFMDMRAIMPAQFTTAQEMNMEIEVEGADVVFPANMEAGKWLEAGEMTLRAFSNGNQFMQTRFIMSNRKVEATEMITIKTGTFECLRISYDLDVKTVLSRKFHSVQWYARGVGLVKSETYDKNGKLESSMELSQFEK